MTIADREKWNQKYAEKTALSLPEPDEWLIECVKNLPPGRALDLACGLGQNALLLSEWGWEVDAVDISDVGLQIPRTVSDTLESLVNWICADLDEWQPEKTYDLILTFRFLDWTSLPRIVKQGLKAEGVYCFETFSVSQMDRKDNHLKNAAFTVARGDISKYFHFLKQERLEFVHRNDRDVVRFLGRAVR